MRRDAVIGIELGEHELKAAVVEGGEIAGRYFQEFTTPIPMPEGAIKLAPLLAPLKKLRKQIPKRYRQVALVLPDYFVRQHSLGSRELHSMEVHAQMGDSLVSEPGQYSIEQVYAHLERGNHSVKDVVVDFCIEQENVQPTSLPNLASSNGTMHLLTLPKRLQSTLVNQCNKAGFEPLFITIQSHALLAINQWATTESQQQWLSLHLSELQWSCALASKLFTQVFSGEQLMLAPSGSVYRNEPDYVLDTLKTIMIEIEKQIAQLDEETAVHERLKGIWLSCDFESEHLFAERFKAHISPIEPMPTALDDSPLRLDIAPLTGERLMLLAVGGALAAQQWRLSHVLD